MSGLKAQQERNRMRLHHGSARSIDAGRYIRFGDEVTLVRMSGIRMKRGDGPSTYYAVLGCYAWARRPIHSNPVSLDDYPDAPHLSLLFRTPEAMRMLGEQLVTNAGWFEKSLATIAAAKEPGDV